MSMLTNTILLIELIAFFLFGAAFLFQRKLRQPVERIRLVQGTLLAIAVALSLVFVPIVPPMNVAVLPKTSTALVSVALQHNAAPDQMPVAANQTEAATLPPQKIHVTTEPTFSATPSETAAKPVAVFTAKSLWSFVDRTVPTVFGLGLLYYAGLWLVGVVRLRRILNTASPASDALLPKGVRLLVSAKTETPFVCLALRNFLRPIIVVPENLSKESLRFALAHERVHLSNGDLWCWQALNLLAPLFWVQPFYPMLCRQLRLDQDYLADQAASRTAAMPEDYASVLLSFARLRKPLPFPAALGMGDRPTFLHRRIEMILQNDRLPLRTRPRRFVMCVFAGLLGTMVLILGTVRLTAQDAFETDPKSSTNVAFSSGTDNITSHFQEESDIDELVELVFTALDPDGKPVPGTLVGLRYSDWNHPVEKTWTTDSDGCVKTKIPVSIIDNQGRFEAYNRERGLLGRAEFSYGKSGIPNPVNVRCTLQKSRRMTGTVVDADGKPVEGAAVSGTGRGALRIACAKTDAQGRFEYDASSEKPISSIFAMKPGAGYGTVAIIADSEKYFEKLNDKNWKNEKHDNGPFTFRLEKGEPVTVRVVDVYHRPLEGALVAPQSQVYYKDHVFETNGLETLFGQKTNVDGVVVFDWLPAWLGQVGFTASGANPRFEKSGEARYYGRKSETWYRGLPSGTLEITLPRRVEVRGSVRLEDGTPVPWCQLEIITGNMMTVGESTDHNGNFSYDVNAYESVTILPYSGSEQPLVAAKKWIDRVVSQDAPESLPRFDFVLIPGTKLSGRILSPKNQKPVPDAYLWVSELKGTGELMPREGFSERRIRADKNGEYSVSFPPGLYRAQNQDKSIVKTFEIKNEEAMTIDF